MSANRDNQLGRKRKLSPQKQVKKRVVLDLIANARSFKPAAQFEPTNEVERIRKMQENRARIKEQVEKFDAKLRKKFDHYIFLQRVFTKENEELGFKRFYSKRDREYQHFSEYLADLDKLVNYCKETTNKEKGKYADSLETAFNQIKEEERKEKETKQVEEENSVLDNKITLNKQSIKDFTDLISLFETLKKERDDEKIIDFLPKLLNKPVIKEKILEEPSFMSLLTQTTRGNLKINPDLLTNDLIERVSEYFIKFCSIQVGDLQFENNNLLDRAKIINRVEEENYDSD